MARIIPEYLPINNISELGGILIISPANGQILVYDSSKRVWVNSTFSNTIEHGSLLGLDQDDHIQYLNTIRGDLRYYTNIDLDNGQLDTRYYTETELDSGQLDTRYYTETELDVLLDTKLPFHNFIETEQGGFARWEPNEIPPFYSFDSTSNEFTLLKACEIYVNGVEVDVSVPQTVSIPSCETTYILVDENGNLITVRAVDITSTTFVDNVALFVILACHSNYLVGKANRAFSVNIGLSGYLKRCVGTVIARDGGVLMLSESRINEGTSPTDRMFRVAGLDFIESYGIVTTLIPLDPVYFIVVYKDATGMWDSYTPSRTVITEVPMVYNADGTMALLGIDTTSTVGVFRVYVGHDDLNIPLPQYGIVANNGAFDTVQDARDAIEDGLISSADNQLFYLDMAQLGYIIVEYNVNGGYIVEVISAKSSFDTRVVSTTFGAETNHGLLSGLGNDDHTQYFNQTRGDIRYYTQTELDGGQLDTRYYTETESDVLLSGKSNTTHNHDHGTLTGLNGDDHTQYLNTTRHSDLVGNPHNTTLDVAYNGEAGSGAGRTITVNSGPVVLSASDGYSPLQLTSLGSAPTIGLSGGQCYVGTDGILYVYDSTRTRWISVNHAHFIWGKNGGTGGEYLRIGGDVRVARSGVKLARNAVLIGITAQSSGGLATKEFEVRKNNGTLIQSFSLVANSYINTSFNIELNSGDYLNVWASSTGADVNDPVVTVMVGWRA